MTYHFSSSQLSSIQDVVDELTSSATPSDAIDWAPAYQAVIDALKQALQGRLVAKADRANVRAVYVWLKGALMVNSGVGRFSSIIRGYTTRQLLLHGAHFSEQAVLELMQTSSNKIGESIVKDGILGADNGQLVTMDVIAQRDAQQALAIVFSHIDKDDSAVRDGAAWSGAVLFGMFAGPNVSANDESLRLFGSGKANKLSTLEDFRNVLFAIDAYTHASDNAIDFTAEDKQIFWELVNPDFKAGFSLQRIKRLFSSVKSLLNASSDGGERLQKVLEGTAAYEPVKLIRQFGVNQLLDKLAAIFGYDIQTTNEQQFLRNAQSLFGVIRKDQLALEFELLDPAAKDYWCSRAKNSVAYRYALVTATPFVIIGDDSIYDRVNFDGRYNHNRVPIAYLEDKSDTMARLLNGEVGIC